MSFVTGQFAWYRGAMCRAVHSPGTRLDHIDIGISIDPEYVSDEETAYCQGDFYSKCVHMQSLITTPTVDTNCWIRMHQSPTALRL